MVHYYVSELWASTIPFIIGVLLEVKDGLVPKSEYGFWGGIGFSWADIVYDALGLITALVIDIIWPPHIRPKRNKNEEENLEEEAWNAFEEF